MTHNWIKKILEKWRWLKISKKYTKGIINGYVYVENFINFKNMYGMYYRGSKLCSRVMFNLTMEWPPCDMTLLMIHYNYVARTLCVSRWLKYDVLFLFKYKCEH